LANLQSLYLKNNYAMSGTVPTELAGLKNLQTLEFAKVPFTGTFPDIPTLTTCDLTCTKFTSVLTPICKFSFCGSK